MAVSMEEIKCRVYKRNSDFVSTVFTVFGVGSRLLKAGEPLTFASRLV